MPDGTGAPIAPLSPFAHRLDVLKRYRHKEAGETRKRRRITAQRLAHAERLLAEIIDASEVIAEVALDKPHMRSRAVCLLMTLHPVHFQQLCELGAELEDDEDSDGGEDDQDMEPDHEGETSLGSPDGIVNQARWAEGYYEAMGERERDTCDDEPSMVAAEGANPNLALKYDLGERDEHLAPEKMAAARARYAAGEAP